MEKERNIEKIISSTYDSVNLINKTLTEPKTEKLSKIVEANYKHIELMLTKDWFVEALTLEQKTELETCITLAKAY